MKYNKYHIILDTTNLFTSEFNVKNFNQPVLDFKNFVNKYGETKIIVYIPEIVRDERIYQNVMNFLKHRGRITDSFNKISDSGVKIATSKLKKFNYEKKIRENVNKIIKNNGFGVIKYTKADGAQIIKRFFKKKKPFDGNSNTEKGFKDTLIWLSVLDFAKTKKDDQVIFITNNSSDFTDELKVEFRNKVGRNIEFFLNFEKAKEYLDSKLNLQLELKDQYDKYLKIVSEKIGEILIAIHKNKYPLYIQDRYFSFKKTNYDAFTLSSINSLTNIVDKGTITTLTVHLKLKGFYHKKDETESYSPIHRISTISSILEPFGTSGIFNEFIELHEKNVDAEISISVDNFTENIDVTDIKIKESSEYGI